MATDNEIDFKCLAPLATVYPQHFKQPGTSADAARAVYHRLLSDLDGDLLEAATLHWLSSAHPFHPSPGEIRELALHLKTQSEKSAEEAWVEVSEAIAQIGHYRAPVWSSPLVEKAVAAFGWKDLSMSPVSQMSIIRAQFLRVYDVLLKRDREYRLMAPETRRMLERISDKTDMNLLLSKGEHDPEEEAEA